jgi:hypothetical protein
MIVTIVVLFAGLVDMLQALQGVLEYIIRSCIQSIIFERKLKQIFMKMFSLGVTHNCKLWVVFGFSIIIQISFDPIISLSCGQKNEQTSLLCKFTSSTLYKNQNWLELYT